MTMNAIYVSVEDPLDTRSWSGSTFWAAKGLESAGFKLDYIGPLENPYQSFTRLKRRLINLTGMEYSPYGEPMVLKAFSRQVEKELEKKTGKLIISCGRPHITFLRTELPFVYFDDGSISAMVKNFPKMMHLWPGNLKWLYRAERLALERCLFGFYASDWAAEGALNYHGHSFESKIRVVPWGANMEVDRSRAEIASIVKLRSSDVCRLLFVGIDWQRKGGPLSVAVAEELNRMGFHVELNIVGCKPEGEFPPFVKIHGFVSKKTPEGASLLDRLYRNSHFFIMPSPGEPYGIVYVEACSYGLPVIGNDIGGPATIIRDGVNGFLVPGDVRPALYAERIADAWRDRNAYEALCATTFGEYESRLNWKVFGRTIYDFVSEAIDGRKKI